MNRHIVISAVFAIGLILASVFAFLQTQSLAEIQDTSTQVVADLNSIGTQQAQESANMATQAANEAIDSSTAQANIANNTATQVADDTIATITQLSNNANASSTSQANIANSTATQAANNTIVNNTAQANIANTTATHIVRVSNANQQRNQATATQLVENVIATDTKQANIANSTATQAANLITTQVVISTETAQQVATEYIEATVSVLVYSEVQAAIEAENVALSMTLDATGYTRTGIRGESAELPNDFVLFDGQSYEIAFPESFVAGDFVGDTTDNLEDTMDALNFSDSFELLETIDGLLFFAIDTELVSGMPRTTVSLIREEAIVEGTTLADYFASSYFGIQGDFALITADILPINGQLTARSIIDQELSNGAVRQLQYIFAVDGIFYVLTYTTPITEYANIRSNLEASAATLRIR